MQDVINNESKIVKQLQLFNRPIIKEFEENGILPSMPVFFGMSAGHP